MRYRFCGPNAISPHAAMIHAPLNPVQIPSGAVFACRASVASPIPAPVSITNTCVAVR